MKPRWNHGALEVAYLIVTTLISSSFSCEESAEWTCVSGECVPLDQVCDGAANCSDGSDETAGTCAQVTCPPFFFRCTYGACVPKDAECNGQEECADGSDEAAGLCEPDSSVPNTICSSQQFQCDSGACISQQDACNGRIDCPDQSDETTKACSANFCPAPFFRCGYGACIASDKRCDGQADCSDGSDEGACEIYFTQPPIELPTRPTMPTRPRTTLPASRPTTKLPQPTPQPTKKVPVSSSSSCIAPNIRHSKLVYEHDESQQVEPGAEVPNYAQIKFECKRDFYREGQGSSLCLNGQWMPATFPVCTRYCPGNILNGVTFSSICVYDGANVGCGEWIRPGTLVIVNCRFKYRVPDHNPTQRLLCQDDGQWDYPPPRCEPICGEELVESVPFAVNGVVTNITAVPWHVAIYKSVRSEFKHTCGGTILNAKVVISAAHCFWDNANEELHDKVLFQVGAGKTLRDYKQVEPRAAHFRNISTILVPAEFQGANNNFKADIAVLVLTNALIFSTFIAPVCIRWESGGAKSLPTDTFGQIAGWGRDETGDFSPELKTTTVPMTSFEVCQREAGARLADSITDDKFCVLNKHNKNVCEGDSGGGFVVKRETDGRTRHYLWGVVSNGVPNRASCSDYQFVNYVNIQFYEMFITSVEIRNRPK